MWQILDTLRKLKMKIRIFISPISIMKKNNKIILDGAKASDVRVQNLLRRRWGIHDLRKIKDLSTSCMS